MSMFIPLERETAIIPTLSAPVEISAMAASPFIFALLPILSRAKAHIITTGIATPSGYIPKAVATAREPKPT